MTNCNWPQSGRELAKPNHSSLGQHLDHNAMHRRVNARGAEATHSTSGRAYRKPLWFLHLPSDRREVWRSRGESSHIFKGEMQMLPWPTRRQMTNQKCQLTSHRCKIKSNFSSYWNLGSCLLQWLVLITLPDALRLVTLDATNTGNIYLATHNYLPPLADSLVNRITKTRNRMFKAKGQLICYKTFPYI